MTMTPEGMVLIPMAMALLRTHPCSTLVMLCGVLVVVLPSFTLAMGAWVLALLLLAIRVTGCWRHRPPFRPPSATAAYRPAITPARLRFRDPGTDA